VPGRPAGQPQPAGYQGAGWPGPGSWPSPDQAQAYQAQAYQPDPYEAGQGGTAAGPAGYYAPPPGQFPGPAGQGPPAGPWGPAQASQYEQAQYPQAPYPAAPYQQSPYPQAPYPQAPYPAAPYPAAQPGYYDAGPAGTPHPGPPGRFPGEAAGNARPSHPKSADADPDRVLTPTTIYAPGSLINPPGAPGGGHGPFPPAAGAGAAGPGYAAPPGYAPYSGAPYPGAPYSGAPYSGQGPVPAGSYQPPPGYPDYVPYQAQQAAQPPGAFPGQPGPGDGAEYGTAYRPGDYPPPGYGASTYGASTYGASTYGAPTYGAPAYGSPYPGGGTAAPTASGQGAVPQGFPGPGYGQEFPGQPPVPSGPGYDHGAQPRPQAPGWHAADAFAPPVVGRHPDGQPFPPGPAAPPGPHGYPAAHGFAEQGATYPQHQTWQPYAGPGGYRGPAGHDQIHNGGAYAYVIREDEPPAPAPSRPYAGGGAGAGAGAGGQPTRAITSGLPVADAAPVPDVEPERMYGPDDPAYGPPGPDWYKRVEERATATTGELLAARGPFEPLRSVDEGYQPAGDAEDGAGQPGDGMPETPEDEPLDFLGLDTPTDPEAGPLGQVKDLYAVAGRISTDRLDRHFDELLARQRQLISDYFNESSGLGAAETPPSFGFDSAESLA